MTLVTTVQADETEMDSAEKPRPKVGRIPSTLRLLHEHDAADAQENWQATEITARKGDAQFMLLLVTLFVIVNVTLITLINHKDKTATPKPEPVAASPSSMLIPSATASANPAAPTVNTVIPLTTAPAQPVVAQPSATQPALTPAQAYITPASPNSTKTIAAPVQSVSVQDHSKPATEAASIKTAEPSLTVIHTPPAELAPAAGTSAAAATNIPPATPTVAQPAAGSQDLLSVITKD